MIDEILQAYKALSPVGLGALSFAILVLSYFNKWRWGKDYDKLEAACEKRVTEMRADYEKRLADQEAKSNRIIERQEQSIEKWQNAAFATVGALEEQAGIGSGRRGRAGG